MGYNYRLIWVVLKYGILQSVFMGTLWRVHSIAEWAILTEDTENVLEIQLADIQKYPNDEEELILGTSSHKLKKKISLDST